MNGAQRSQATIADKQRSPRQVVIYLEGKTDAEAFFALLGVKRPRDDIHQDIYVVGLDKGSGGSEVRARVDVAARDGLTGVFGVVDGDGRDISALAGCWDVPYGGPLFSWKAYCVENLLAKAAWPTKWGQPPNWTVVLSDYSPYAALNRIHRELMNILHTLGLAKFTHPQHGQPLVTDADVKSALTQDKGLLMNKDVGAMFDNAATMIRTAVAASLDEGHALVNGKWLVRHYARLITSRSENECRAEWAEAVRAAGGLQEVRDFWQRITGSTP